ncbi:MAG: helical backbone metal receptor [Planctomycetota bacterium]|nr:helical backbone metal receptor [Planctomycetota bacterium]
MRFLTIALFLFSSLPLRAGQPLRAVSLSPSITEALFAIGAGESVVGVTRYCRYPPEAEALPAVGDFFSPNYERILSLVPDYVVVRDDYGQDRTVLEDLGLRCVTVNHRTLRGLIESYRILGKIFGRTAEGEEIAVRLDRELSPAAWLPGAFPPPRILMIVGRDYGERGLVQAYAVGRDGLYDLILSAAGGENAYQGELAFPMLTAEGVASLDPDLVVELLPDDPGGGPDEATLRQDWDALANLAAVRNGRICIVRASYAFVPGPRLVRLREDLERILADSCPPAARDGGR